MTLAFAGVRLPLARFALTLEGRYEADALGIVGPSGAGKTSLLELLAGARRPRAGRVTLGDTTLDDVAAGVHVPARRRRIGYVPQDGALFPHLDVRANILYGARGSDLGRVVDSLEIGGLLARRPHTLSGGEIQRVALARALMADPALLLFDEPLAGLDAPLRSRVLRHLQQVRDVYRLPFVYVTHAEDEIRALCDRVLVLREGCVVAEGPPAILDAGPRR